MNEEQIINLNNKINHKASKEELVKAVDDANRIHQTIMDKLEEFSEKLQEVEISIAKLPELLANKFDERYANKQYEEDLKTLKDKIENRNYEWLKYLIMVAIGALLAYFGLK